MWTFHNPVRIRFGAGVIDGLAEGLSGRSYAVVTYPDPYFAELTNKIADQAGSPAIVIDDVVPNPDYKHLMPQCIRFNSLGALPEVFVALGGGSVIDSAKVFATARGNFEPVARFLETGLGAENLAPIPIIAAPTTAGTGSEVTSWATVWDEARGCKFSLSLPKLYPEMAFIDPKLMIGKPHQLTLSTALDSLSHALESIWNVNANPVSAQFAIAAAKRILTDLPRLLRDPGNLELRASIAEAALSAGLAFSNTKTAIAHNISYPMTLDWGVQHGIACSFTLPTVLRSVIGIGGFRESALCEIFGHDLEDGADDLELFLRQLGVATNFRDYGVPAETWPDIIRDAFAGERGKNFVGQMDRFVAAQDLILS
ncbi:MAG: iron-containing alcohol dehydrogenase PsrA [Rhizobiaceae bacterium]